jgi:8-oxo-dGTP pyrophosphatase MutT (NUDIX family)
MNTDLRNATLLFLLRESDAGVPEVCLALKKRGFGKDRWNGAGGKMNDIDKTVLDTAIRETTEEIAVIPQDLKKVAELTFIFPHNKDWNQLVHVYTTRSWTGSPTESEEMQPKWFPVSEIPYDKMWADDIMWLPEVLDGKLIKATFIFGEGDVIREKKLINISHF